MTFDLLSYRVRLSARAPVRFPENTAGNVLRGAIGAMLRKIHCTRECNPEVSCERRSSCAYAQIFEPRPEHAGPSGFSDWPRPFVLRAAHLSGKTFAREEPFWFDINLFETRRSNIDVFAEAFGHWANLVSVQTVGLEPKVSIHLVPALLPVQRLRIHFRTPTELKGASKGRPEFQVLFARAQDRVSTLRELYGAGSLSVDFRAMRSRAAAIRLINCELQHVSASRRSGRTGQVHGIGGFVGFAEYEGALSEFLPYIEAARWTGVGRQCVWGKGELAWEVIG